MTSLALFEEHGWSLRTITEDNKPWFVASDVAKALGYRDAHNMVRRLDADEQGYSNLSTPSGEQRMVVVTQSGVIHAVFGSSLPNAGLFRRWVTEEVVPQILETGTYSLAGSTPALPQDYPSALRELAETVERESALKLELEAAAPKVAAFEAFIDADGSMSMEEAAKTFAVENFGRNKLFEALYTEGILIRGSRLPYQQFMRYFEVRQGTHQRPDGTHIHRSVRVRPEGLVFISRRLGLPLRERRPALELVSSG